MNIYELFGRQAEQLAGLREYFDLTQRLLRQLAAGEMVAARLRVDDKGWMVADPPASPSSEAAP